MDRHKDPEKPYRGRFAPSPTGPLHLGSLLCAVASFVDARHHAGSWHLRIDDLDTPRIQSGATSAILEILESAGLTWDGPVLYQSRQLEKYDAALSCLEQQGLVYACTCSRKALQQLSAQKGTPGVYPGYCSNKDNPPTIAHALRLRTDSTAIGFKDRIQGYQEQDVSHRVGDFIVRRKDRIHAYQIAVVVDDQSQGISHVVRGIDLLESTARQIFLQRKLSLSSPLYAHIPLVVDRQGTKLSKQSGAKGIRNKRVSKVVHDALCLLRHPPPVDMANASSPELLSWAIEIWDIQKLEKLESVA
ncbi:MAG: tRNA glutamyl-Q(34) synthetase GluQRS [Methylococcus sp.]|nr:MAG: tRNA glutamyl-Q(34) synthetase GluQRS [Methylococcus sp.]